MSENSTSINSTYLHNNRLAGSSTHLPPHGEKIEFDAAGHSLKPVDAATALEALSVPGFSRVDAETVAADREALEAQPLPHTDVPAGTPGQSAPPSESLEGKTVTIKITGGVDEDLVGNIVRGVVVADSLLSEDSKHPAKATKSPDEEIDGEIAKAERVGEEESAKANAARGTAPPVFVPDPNDKNDAAGDPNAHPVDGQAEQTDAAKQEVTKNADIVPHTPLQPHETPQSSVPPGPPVKNNPTPATTAPETAKTKKARETREQAEMDRKAKEAEGLKAEGVETGTASTSAVSTAPAVTHDGSLNALAAAELALKNGSTGDSGGQG